MHRLLIMRKQIDLDRSPVLYDRPFTAESFAADWQVRSGEWQLDGEWLTGSNPLNAPGMVTSRANYFGNVMLEFEARTVLPSTHDIDCMWNGSWDEEKDACGVAYILGLQGWWEGKAGVEKSPEFRLKAATPLFPFEPGRIYRLQVGSIDGHIFVFVDGKLVIELTDPDPIDHTRYGMIGFEAYASMMQVRNLIVRQIVWQDRPLAYEREF